MVDTFNGEQWKSIVRFVGAFLGGLLVAHGLITELQLNTTLDDITNAIPAIYSGVVAAISLGSLIWGIYSHSHKATLAQAAAIKGVEQITISPSASDGALAAAKDKNIPKVTFAKTPVFSNYVAKDGIVKE